MEKDLSELNLLSIFHFVMAGLTALTGSIPIVHVLLGLKMVSDPSFLSGGGPAPPFNPGWLFVGVGALVILVSWTLAFLLLLSGLSLRSQRRYWLCFVLGCVVCLNVPLGTTLGIFTLLVLSRPSVKALFGVGRVG